MLSLSNFFIHRPSTPPWYIFGIEFISVLQSHFLYCSLSFYHLNTAWLLKKSMKMCPLSTVMLLLWRFEPEEMAIQCNVKTFGVYVILVLLYRQYIPGITPRRLSVKAFQELALGSSSPSPALAGTLFQPLIRLIWITMKHPRESPPHFFPCLLPALYHAWRRGFKRATLSSCLLLKNSGSLYYSE
jgi:hypothetical protein